MSGTPEYIAEHSDVSLKRQRESEDEDGYSSSDDSVEFILAPRPGTGQTANRPVAPPPEALTTAPTAQPGLRQPEPVEAPKAAKPKVPGVDVDAVAQIGGVPITQLDLNQFEDKPWRKPGADITDYFNYGFDEFTWTAYCSKQDHMRTTYTPQKVMAQMGMPPMFMPGMMPPGMRMPGMP